MRVRARLLVAGTVAGLLSGGAAVPAGAEPALPPGTVQGAVNDVDDPADPAAPGVLAQLHRWDATTSAFRQVLDPLTDRPVSQETTHDNSNYSFAGLEPGCYTVRFADVTGGTYVAYTWPSSTGRMPTSPVPGKAAGVAEIPDPDDATQCDPAATTPTDPPTGPEEPVTRTLDVTILKELRNDGALPDVTGTRRVGYRLSATPGEWNVPTASMTFGWQWQRVDSAGTARDIPGATRSTYLLTPADVGNGVRVRATGYRVGYAPESGFSDETEVGRGYSATGLRLAYSRIRTTARGRVRVTVTPSALPPTGTVTVRIDGRNRVSTTLRATQLGSVALVLPRLARGRHRVVAAYGGFRGLYGSTSRALTLTVVR